MIDLKNQNALSGFAFMDSDSVDLIVTDPPYRTISGGKNGNTGGMIAANDGKIFEHNDIHCSEYLPHMFRVLKPGCHCYVFTNFLNLFEIAATMVSCGFKIHNLLVWKKNNATPSGWYMKNAEYVIFARKGPAKRIINCGSKTVHDFDNILGNKSHPTEKPVDLLTYYIENSSEVGDLILDPFSGTGSTAMACKKTDRDFIGFEISKGYYLKACIRLGILP